MKLKQLKSMLDGVETFAKPNIQLEQFPTPPDIAAEVLHHIWSAGDIEDQFVVDLGCGGGILTIGAALLGAEHVLGVDIDPDPLEISRGNAEQFEVVGAVSFIQADATSSLAETLRQTADTVIMNPPFGTRNKGADLAFVETAALICRGSIYSLHKSSTRQHLVRKAGQRGLKCEVIAQLRFNIDRMYSFHKSESRDIEVDFVRFTKLVPQ